MFSKFLKKENIKYCLAGLAVAVLFFVFIPSYAEAAAPVVIFNSVAERTDASGKVDISMTVSDSDGDNQVMAKVEYVAGSGCDFSTPSRATIDEVNSHTGANFGDPKVQNKNEYQIGTSTGWILTSFGANTVITNWMTLTDLPTGDGTYCLKVTVNDNNGGVSSTTTLLIVDNVAPANFGPLTFSKKNNTSVTVNFNSSATESNFSEYRIYYKAGSSGVKRTDSLFSSANDSALASQTFSGHATTTVTGLNSGTTYVFNLFTYDAYGHVASSTSEFSTATKNFPAIPSSLNQYKADGVTAINNGAVIVQNEVKLFATSSDADSDALILYYQLATSSGSFITVTTTPVDACSSGTAYASCPGRVWYTPAATKQADITSIPDDNYKWQVLACDVDSCSKSWKNFNASVPNFLIGSTPPTKPDPLTPLASTTVSIKLGFPAPVTAANFFQYKIYYRLGSTTEIRETDNLWGSSSDANLSSLNFNGKSSTTITGLAVGTVYSFSIWAYDLAGNKSSSTFVWERTDRYPSIAMNSASELVDASGRVDFSFSVSDIDLDDQTRAKVEYFADSYCHSSANKALLDETDSSTAASFGDPKVQNKNAYQIGTSTGWIITSSGTNNINSVWLSKSDLPAGDGVYCFKITASDNRGGTAVATTSLIIDNKVPAGFGPLTLSKKNSSSVTVNFNSSAAENNFSQYKIYYKAGSSGVKQTDTLFGSSSDSALGSQSYLGHTTTTITGLSYNTVYVFNIFAYDAYGHVASSTSELTTAANDLPSQPSTLNQYLSDGVTAIANGALAGQGEVRLFATSTEANFGEVYYYYQLATTSGDYIVATTTPVGACSSGTAYASCPTRVWYSTVATKQAAITGIPDDEYKWQVLICDDNGCALAWKNFNAATPNFTIDTTPPTNPGNLTLDDKSDTSVIINFGSTSTEIHFFQYKIYYKAGSAGVKETDALFGSSSDSALGAQNYSGHATTAIAGLNPGTQYVFNIFAYDLVGRRATATSELVVTTKAFPSIPSSLNQYEADGTTQISNQTTVDESEIRLFATSSSASGAALTIYYQLATTSGTFITATTTPAGACASGTAYDSCPARVWYTPAAIKKVDINSLSYQNYKWQALACNSDGCSRNWTKFNVALPNFILGPIALSVPGPLTVLASSSDSIKLSFPAPVTGSRFTQYKIYYHLGSTTPVKQTDALWSSSSDANLGYINFNGKSSTTVVGLNPGTVYSFSLWAYDSLGSITSSTFVWDRTDYLPNIVFNSAAERTNGTGILDISFSITDPDGDNQVMAKLEYAAGSSCNFSSPGKATLSEVNSHTNANFGDPKVQNKNEYPIGTSTGWILTSFGGNMVNFLWPSKIDLPLGEGVYCLRLTANDNRNGTNSATTTVIIDNAPPSAFGPLGLSKKNQSSITLTFGSAATESNFRQYKIYYKTGTSGVKENNILIGSSTDAALGNLNYSGQTTTTVSGLQVSTDYVFNIFAYDAYGNKASGTPEFTTKTPLGPTGRINSVTEATDGSGRINISITASDADGFDSRAKLEYFTNSGCTGSPAKPTLDENQASISATYGAPVIQNKNAYQLGTSTGYIITSSGANTVSFSWLSHYDMPDTEGTYCLRLTVNDGSIDQSVPTTTVFYFDNQAPTAPGNLTMNKKIGNTAFLNYGTETTETNFYRYRIFYKTGAAPVAETDSEKTDSNLNYQNYNNAATTSISGLAAGSWYAANIWAYDDYGNKASAATPVSFKIDKKPENPADLLQFDNDGSPIANGGVSGQSTVKLRANVLDVDSTSTTFYFQLLDNASGFATATTVPAETCVDNTAFGACSAKVWAIATSSGPSSWYNSGWRYRKKISINYAQVAANLTDFPVLISLASDAELAARARADGNDIIFTAADGRTLLPFAKEKFNSATGESEFWVKSDISSVADTFLYIYYGNPNQTADLSSTGVWNNNFKAVWHLAETGTTARVDSTANGNNAATNNFDGSEKGRAGIIDGADDFNSVNKFLQAPDSASLDITGGLTVSGWFNPDTTAAESLEAGGKPRYQFVGLKWNASGAADCSPDGAMDPAMINPYAGATYGNSSWTGGSSWKVYDTSLSSIYYSSDQYTIDLNKVWGNTAVNSEAYIGAYIYSPDNRAVDISRGSDDGSELWVNGRLISQDCNSHTYTADAFVNTVNLKQGWNTIIVRVVNGSADWVGQWRISANASGLLTLANPRILVDKQSYQVSQKGDYLSAFYGTTTVDTVIATGTWQYFTLTGDSSSLEIKLNGASIASTTFSTAPTVNDQPLRLGYGFDGRLDEINIANTRASSAWTSTTYNNQNNPGAFASLNTQEERTGMGALVTIPSVPDSSAGYKWQALVCDEENFCSNWTQFNASVPNFIISGNGPTAPGALTLQSKTSHSLTLNFGSASATDFFRQYKIFYKAGASGVTENDLLIGSSSNANLAYINYNGASSITVNNLPTNTQYVFNIWAYDSVGRKISAAAEFTTTTNAGPTASFVSAAERTNGFGIVDIAITANDANQDDLKAKLEFFTNSRCVGVPYDPTLDEADYNATSTYGDAKINNSNAYQIGNSSGWIITSSGANTVNFDWLSPLDIPAGDGVYCLRLTANDGTEDQLTPATTTLIIDNVKPTAPGALNLAKRGATYLQLSFGAQTRESNFYRYRIFYKQGTGVTESDTELADANLAYINYNGAPTTTVAGLNNGERYSFKIFAYDNYGHKSSSTETNYATDHSPSAAFNSAAQRTNASGIVDVSFAASDADGDTLAAKLEYFADANCHGAPQDPTLDDNTGNISATFGHPDINNSSSYQIGDASRIITNQGRNTINFNWLSGMDISAGDGVYCLRLTVNDGKGDQSPAATTSLIIDNAAPTAPGNLSVSRVNGDYVFLNFGSASSDSHFREYKVFYHVGTSNVTESDQALTKAFDYNLGFANYNGRATTAVSSLTAEAEYSFNIWAYDYYGNKSSAVLQVSTTTYSSTGATWREAEDTVDPTSILYLGKENPVRVRISVANTGDWSEIDQYKIQYASKAVSCAAVSSWSDVPTTTAANDFVMTDSSYFYNGERTVQRFNNIEGYNFIPGNIVKAPSNKTESITLGANDYTELEYGFQATTNAMAGRTYCFRVLKNAEALDAYTRYPELTISPTAQSSFVSAAEKSDGSKIVRTTLNVSHPAGYPTKVKFEYMASSSCDFSSPLRPTLSVDPLTVSATYGLPDLSNNQTYQIGSSTGNMVITAFGANTVAFDWPTLNDFSGVDKTYCLRATAYDDYDDQAEPATTTVIIDQVKPTNPGNLATSSKTSGSVVLLFGASSSDTHFKEYRIYYKEGSSGVTENDSLWSSSSDPNLAYINYNGAATTTIAGLTINKQYVFRIWAYDQYGNKASSSEEISVFLWSTKESGGPWRWYQDQANETPQIPLGGENVTPNNITDGQVLKLRMSFREVQGIDALSSKVRLQYSTYSNFSADVNWVGEIVSTTDWTYADGIDLDNDPIINLLLSTTTAKITHNESGISASSATHPANSWGEWEFTIRNNGAASGTVYYFRGYDNQLNQPIYLRPGGTYPSLIAAAGSLTLVISGLPSGTATEGVVTNATTSETSVPFGVLAADEQAIGAQRFIVSTNAEGGYGLYVFQTNDLTSSNGAKIDPVPWLNSSPAAWPSIFNPSNFGYHSGDDTLSGASPSRFAPDDTYAQFVTTGQEISYSSIPVVNETFDLIFRAGVGVTQSAGDYSTNIVYILTPTF